MNCDNMITEVAHEVTELLAKQPASAQAVTDAKHALRLLSSAHDAALPAIREGFIEAARWHVRKAAYAEGVVQRKIADSKIAADKAANKDLDDERVLSAVRCLSTATSRDLMARLLEYKIDERRIRSALTRLIERGSVAQSGRGSYAAIENVVVAEINGDEF